MADDHRLQPGQLVATARTAEQDQELVADELATQVDEDRRSAGQARTLRTLEEIRADILALERETEGLLGDILNISGSER